MTNLFGYQLQFDLSLIIGIVVIFIATIVIVSLKYFCKDNGNNNNNDTNKGKNPPTTHPKLLENNNNNNDNNNTSDRPMIPSSPHLSSKSSSKSLSTSDGRTQIQQTQKEQTCLIHNNQKETNFNHPPIPQEINFNPSNPSTLNYRSYPTEQEGMNNTSNQPLFNKEVVNLTFVKRTQTETKIEQLGRKPITITQTKTEEIDIPSNLLWSPFVQGLRFAVKEDQGKRQHMENSTNIWDMDDHKNDSHKKMSFSLFDGHLGDAAAKFCTKHLPQYVAQFIDNIEQSMDNDDDMMMSDDDMTWQNDQDDDIAAAIRKAFYKTDQEFKKYAFDNQCEAGAVGVYAYYDYDTKASSPDCIYVANAGDCRAILCSDGKIQQLTIDHNPKNPLEKKRCCSILDSKGNKCIGDNSDLLCGQISVTRAIGDYYKIDKINNDNGNNEIYKHEKLPGLTCNPHIIKHKLQEKDEFLIIACDGLWDVVTNQEAKAECRRSLRRDGDVDKAAQKLIDFAKAKSCQRNFDDSKPLTSDNISVMVIGFANKSKDGSEHIGPKTQRLSGGLEDVEDLDHSVKRN
eukprot:CAMPEP_0201569562 /NCGR_PEP_ID=MMETSP0190_2-20130828/11305_1 /ASSEMBLY_ACC=CAM_ASM_000263 /TAXON_ID=37353 /ORGANISM="Rosalina sp." /LENGTH=568 /DNA_ID=CAMNT_0047992003 /DNA_START=224 /DNA_END=1931 /DNA_ORIENTATION=+